MNRLFYMQWQKDFPEAATFNPSAQERKRWGDLGEGDTARRAAFFHIAHDRLASTGFTNPFEPFALTAEVPHPFTQAEATRLLQSMNATPDLSGCGFTVLTPHTFLSHLSENSFAELFQGRFSKDRVLMIDKYYGTIPVIDEGRPKLYPLVDSHWTRIRKQLPTELQELPPDFQFRQGLSHGVFCFKHGFNRDVAAAYERYLVPTLIVQSQTEYTNVIDRLKQLAAKLPKVELWYRGQTRDYLLPSRVAAQAAGLALRQSTTDSSLIPSLYRSIDHYTDDLTTYEQLIREIARWMNLAESVLGPPVLTRSIVEEPSDPFPIVPDYGLSMHMSRTDEHGRLVETVRDYYIGGDALRKGLILQHYGFPTNWVDITSDPHIALWFAIHACRQTLEGYEFERLSWAGTNPEQWPTVFVFALVDGHDPFVKTKALLEAWGTPATRPILQHCGLLGAAGGLARNYPARYVAFKIRLGTHFELQGGPRADELFPGPSEDLVLKSLLGRERATHVASESNESLWWRKHMPTLSQSRMFSVSKLAAQ